MINALSSEELDTVDYEGSTIFHYAIKYNCNNKYEKIFDLLIQRMSVIGLCNKSANLDGETVLHMAAQAGLGPVCIKLINKIGPEGVKIVNSSSREGLQSYIMLLNLN
ncbi:MAG TPA: ankyrin repeat domain-containing protein [Rickettsia endosymbiont of Columbicola hoogstraali]|nr:ankyrin repeat domain-containing protein [Rickettsia endosymbiont of Columbicola hoogstraali]